MISLSDFAEYSSAFLRYALAYVVFFALMAFSAMTIPFPFGGATKAPFVLMAVYYFAVYRPGIIPVWLVFASGIILDLISGLPLGIHAFILVVVRWLVTDQRRFLLGQSFVVVWLVFCIVLIASSLLQWGLFSLAVSALPSTKALWYADALGAVLFPVISFMLHQILKILPAPIRLERDRPIGRRGRR